MDGRPMGEIRLNASKPLAPGLWEISPQSAMHRTAKASVLPVPWKR